MGAGTKGFAVKLYSYSSELIAFAEAKRIKTKCAAAGILIGAVIFFASIILNRSVADVFEPHSAKELTLENYILRHQVNLMSSRADALESQMGELYEIDDNLHMLLSKHTVVRDSIPRLMVDNKKNRIQIRRPGRQVSALISTKLIH